MKKLKSHWLRKRTFKSEGVGQRLVRYLNGQPSERFLHLLATTQALYEVEAARLWTSQQWRDLFMQFAKQIHAFRLIPAVRMEWRKNRWHRSLHWRTPHGKSYGEADAVMDLLKLDEARLIWRLRQCRRCHTWYFARFKHQRFCSETCQQKFFRDDDQFRGRRRVYMRKNRKWHKERKERMRKLFENSRRRKD